ncbi:putative MltA-interacting MipA [Vibrio nigripulchritudo MADA3029]|uniref:MltA-interacting MipA n=2 Tax=Vibrio nigripulchritudo TaxID=28173 RepID=A0AAV2VPI1_9VIBR|nr:MULTISPECIES: MipA/OmpV family protein [Vibrio]EGU55105.1 outer membrane protein V [Vibrio nigripulchritudo ATCC 27043]KJY76526.1 membrane protein [Vibrio nigripulchritudo]UAB72571.1 MipA/OmpV family protein [Vibrio sp. SCSIO 43132]CCN47266.1 putative MltA-interacting MipA [Vibrio nigripulchritudo MADA3020]CCN52530.1 putative MltA-interacting MipA [Vibrio nigripulchritudo MADA3021]
MKKLVALSLALVSGSTFAFEPGEEYGIIGASGTFGQSVYSTEDSAKFGITPNLFYYGERGFIDGSLASYNVLPYVGISGNWRFAQVSNTFDTIPDGIDERDGNLELGLTIGTPGARITYLQDVMNVHGGKEIQVHLGKTFNTPMRRFTLTPYVELDWRDRKLSDHLYGVSAAESSASGLKQYDASSSFVYQAGVIGLYDFSKKLVIISKARMESHDDDSPIVQRNFGWSFEVGLTYKFAGKSW